jgi:hypothetical protein
MVIPIITILIILDCFVQIVIHRQTLIVAETEKILKDPHIRKDIGLRI